MTSSAEHRRYRDSSSAQPIYDRFLLSHEARAELERLLTEKKDRQETVRRWTEFPKAYLGKFEQPGLTYLLSRGDPMRKLEPVDPGIIQDLGPEVALSSNTPEQERRLALARWIVDPHHPLTARVMVNRIWHYHFGRGLAGTPSDFGRMGRGPSHPELLDWLACEFMEGGWSVKGIQRLIVLSSTYRQSSAVDAASLAADAAAGLLWRFPSRRLEAEVIRDTILSVSGRLNLKMGGPGFDLFEPNNNYVKVYQSKTEFGPAEWRRMVYQAKPRNRLDNTFGVFDCPDGAQIAPDRHQSTTPLQALNLLNSPFLVEQAQCFAERLEREVGGKSETQVRRAFRLAFGRDPAAGELTAGIEVVERHGLMPFCRALFNANEFVYLF